MKQVFSWCVVVVVVIIAAACSGCSTQMTSAKAGDFGSNPQVSAVPTAQASAAPSAAAGGTGPANISVKKGGTNATAIVLTVNSDDKGEIEKIFVARGLSDGRVMDSYVTLQAGESAEFEGTDKPDRVMVWVYLKDGTHYKLLDRDF